MQMPRLLQSETAQTRFVVGFGMLGFVIGIALCAYAFYLTAGVLGGVIGWFGISPFSAGRYAGVGFAFGEATKRPQ